MSPEFWRMGGYAVYVWGSFGVAAVIYLWNVVAPRRRRHELLETLAEGE
ncbi:MAG: heme exporter protein CcmD [Solimonas sp.]